MEPEGSSPYSQSARHLSLSWANSNQSPQHPPTSWRSILILSSHLRLGLPNGLFPSGFPTRTLYTPLPCPYAPHAPPISFFSILPPAQYSVRSTDQWPTPLQSQNNECVKLHLHSPHVATVKYLQVRNQFSSYCNSYLSLTARETAITCQFREQSLNCWDFLKAAVALTVSRHRATIFFLIWRKSPQWARTSSFISFLDHT